MTVYLADGGTVKVLANGTVRYRRGREVQITSGRGSYAENVKWLSAMAYGPGVLRVTR